MKTRNLFSKVLAGALAVLMLVGLLPVFASADEADTNVDGLYLDKTTTLADDGTFTITLEAYATGELKVTQESVPLDIVLVLDQSGSMAYSFTYDESEVTYEQFDGSFKDSASSEVYHVCADGTYQLLEVTTSKGSGDKNSKSTTYTYSCSVEGCPFGTHSVTVENKSNGKPSNQEWGSLLFKKVTEGTTRVAALKATLESFVASVRSDAEANDVEHKIAIVGFASESGYGNNTEILTVAGSNTEVNDDVSIGVAYGDLTATEYSSALVNCDATIIDNAISALAASGATRTDLGMEIAKEILATETDSNRKKVVIMFTDGVPTSSNTFNTTVAGNTIEYAYAMKQDNTDIYTVGIFENADATKLITAITGTSETDNANRFMHASSSNYPDATTWGSYGNPGSAIGYYMSASSSSQLDQVFGNIAETVTGSTKVTLTSEAVLKDIISDEFALPEGFTADSNVTVQLADWNGSAFDDPYTPDEDEGITLTVDTDAKSISVTGFAYKDEYCVDGTATGRKLIVTITGIEATAAAATGEPVCTNASTSGIYEDADATAPVVQFEQPTITISKHSYVLDYAKETTLDASPVLSEVKRIDDAMNKITDSNEKTSITAVYGVLVNENGTLKYTPKTTKWDGYDSFYVFGEKEDANTWAKISVIPANNVYYEDTFVTNDSTGTVGITYTGEWSENVTPGSNAEDANGDIQGWIADLSDDAQDSDGTSHMSSTVGATATFTFTGTGFDVYSRTNMTSGKVYAKISWTDSEGKSHNQGMIVDTESVSSGEGEYYSIPTLWFSGDYNTYTVKITVQNNAEDGADYSYCIDGIRIYNPMNPGEAAEDTNVSDAYGDELNAYFQTVRDMLITQKDFNGTVEDTVVNGYVFIDKNGDGTVSATSNVLAEYVDYGPKNEVYLASGQGIAFNVGAATKVQVGLKAPEGSATALVSYQNGNQGEIEINHSTDLYYEVSPDANGYVVIKNGGAGLLSVTKVKLMGTNVNEEVGIMTTSLDDMLMAVDTFDAMPVMAYSMAAFDPDTSDDAAETPAEPEEPTVPEEPTEPETPSEPTGPSVEIENPQKPTKPEKPVVNKQIEELVKKLFGAFRGWLKH